MLDKERVICSCTELTGGYVKAGSTRTQHTKLELHGMQMVLSLMNQLSQKAVKAR